MAKKYKKRGKGKRRYWVVYMHPYGGDLKKLVFRIFAQAGTRKGGKVAGKVHRGGMGFRGVAAKSAYLAAAKYSRTLGSKGWKVHRTGTVFIAVKK